MQPHMFVSDGSLYDTRADDWSHHPLRDNYSQTHHSIDSIADFKATLRNGAYAWPGGYPLYIIMGDGAALCFTCAIKDFATILSDWGYGRGWRPAGTEINWENNDLTCCHCDAHIAAAYSDE